MRVAVYAPLKSPWHPVPSGDRQIARLILRALEAAGHAPLLASEFRAFEGGGDPAAQAALQEAGAAEAARLIAGWRAAPDRAPDAWLTYHLYHKAPDWLGPAVAHALGIAYVVVEASYAPKQAGGPWALGHDAVAGALRAADGVAFLNPVDRGCVEPLLKPGAVRADLPPFTDTDALAAARQARAEHRGRLAAAHGLPADGVWLLAVGMMRTGAKLDSYCLLAAALEGLLAEESRTAAADAADWRLLVAGDGPARAAVEAALAPLAPRVAWLGESAPDDMPGLYAAADLMVWPAIDEALGLAVLEAQASGLPAVAGDAGALPGVVRDGETGLLAPAGDMPAFRMALARLLADSGLRRRMGAAAARHAALHHGLAAAASALDAALLAAVEFARR